MLTTSKINSAVGAASYLTNDNFAEKTTAAGEYYTHDADIDATRFHGVLAEKYELKIVDKKTLNQLLSGKMPDGQDLAGAKKRTPGWEMTFSAPKSVSVAGLVLKDDAVIKAHDDAVAATLKYIEQEHMITRVKISGKEHLERTNNMLAATFRHDTNRELEPQLHTHAVIFNVTQSADGTNRSLYSKQFFSLQKEFGEHYRRELASNLREAGYELRQKIDDDKRFNFEIASIKNELMQAFSTRTQQIEQHLAENGLSRETATAVQLDTAALATRKEKSKKVQNREELQQKWQKVAQHFDQKIEKDIDASTTAKASEYAQREVMRSVEHLSEREARPSENALEMHLKSRDVHLSRSEIQNVLSDLEKQEMLSRIKTHEFDRRTRKNEVTDGFVTAENVRKEKQLQHFVVEQKADKRQAAGQKYTYEYERQGTIVKQERTTAPQTKSILNATDAESAVSRAEVTSSKHGHAWNNQQRAATVGILSDQTKLHVLQGLAGTAKTSTVLKTVAIEAQKQNRHMIAVAPSQSATKKLADETGIEDARNLSKVLADAKDFDVRAAKELEKIEKQQAILDTKIERLQKIQRDPQAAGYERLFGNKQRQNAILAGESTANLGKQQTFRAHNGELTRKEILGRKYTQAGTVGKLAATAVGHGLKKQAQQKTAELLSEKNQLSQKAAEIKAEMAGQSSKIYILDEASLASTQQLSDLMQHAQRTGATVVMTGDIKQHGSVDAGRAFETVQEVVREKGGRVYEMDAILRQKNEILKEAIRETVAGRVDIALQKVEESGGRITQIDDFKARAQAIAKDYASLSKEERNKTIVIDPSNASREMVTSAIRDELKANEQLDRQEITVKQWRSDGITQAEKGYADAYSGKQIRIDRPSKAMQDDGIKPGDIFSVQDANEYEQTVTLNGKTYDVTDLQKSADIGVQVEKGYAKKEQVVLNLKPADALRNGVTRGENAEVTEIKDGKITVKTFSGKELTLTLEQAKDLDHAYVQTSHKAQGQTQKRSIVNLSSNASNLSNQQTLYVAASRATNDIRIYTDDREKLAMQIRERDGQKTRAIENKIRFEKPKQTQKPAAPKVKIRR